MKLGRIQIGLLFLSLGIAVSAELALAKKKENLAAAQMDQRKRAVHALNRLTFGPRPGDVQRVMAIGVDQWIDQQLHPEKIDDSALDARLAPFRTLRMPTREIVENFPSEQMIKAVADGKQSLPSDPLKRAVYQAQLDRYQDKEDRKQQTAIAGADKVTEDERARRQLDREAAEQKVEELLDLPPDQRMKAVLKMSPEEQRSMTSSLQGDKRDEFLEGMNPRQRETIEALNYPQQVVANELVEGKLLRAIYSDRQLQEVMTDFWFNHFNVFMGKGPDRYLLTSYERDVIRPRALGKFEDLLVATAQSPAMLFYLDNWLSVGPNSDVANGIPKHADKQTQQRIRRKSQTNKSKGQRNGLNENYGRELMELHTLGVNGGYTQQDVTEVARVFTGWTLKQPKQGGGFTFEERTHEPGNKIGSRPSHQTKRRKRRTRSAAHSGAQSFDCEIYLHQAGNAFCFRRPAARSGRSHGANFPEETRQHSRSTENDVRLTGILGARSVSRQSENAAGIRSFRSPRHRRRCN